MEVRNTNFAAFIDVFTSNTYVMVIMSDPGIRKYIILMEKFFFLKIRDDNNKLIIFIFSLSSNAY